MANLKTKQMSKFYQQCLKEGYTDMHDSQQSLKAKVIATDLGLNYGNISKFFEEAKKCYEQVCAEKEEKAKRDKEEKIRRAVNGELLLTLSDSAESFERAEIWSVYIRPDNSIYTICGKGGKLEVIPKIHIKKAGAILSTYHPSQAVYTGATVGGITTGGVHYTKSGYSYTQSNSGKGEIVASINGKEIIVRLVTLSEYTEEKFKRDDEYKSLVKKGKKIVCCKKSEIADLYSSSAGLAAKNGDMTLMMNALSMAEDKNRLPYNQCRRIAELVGRIINGQFPPSEEELYKIANLYSNATNSADLLRAINIFKSIPDYARVRELRVKYEEILQHEKEQAVLRKEAKKKLLSIVLIIVNLCVTVFLARATYNALVNERLGAVGAILWVIATILSIPGMGNVMFRKKYGCLQKILRWLIIVVMLLLGSA